MFKSGRGAEAAALKEKTAELKCSAVCSNFVGETGLATPQIKICSA